MRNKTGSSLLVSGFCNWANFSFWERFWWQFLDCWATEHLRFQKIQPELKSIWRDFPEVCLTLAVCRKSKFRARSRETFAFASAVIWPGMMQKVQHSHASTSQAINNFFCAAIWRWQAIARSMEFCSNSEIAGVLTWDAVRLKNLRYGVIYCSVQFSLARDASTKAWYYLSLLFKTL